MLAPARPRTPAEQAADITIATRRALDVVAHALDRLSAAQVANDLRGWNEQRRQLDGAIATATRRLDEAQARHRQPIPEVVESLASAKRALAEHVDRAHSIQPPKGYAATAHDEQLLRVVAEATDNSAIVAVLEQFQIDDLRRLRSRIANPQPQDALANAIWQIGADRRDEVSHAIQTIDRRKALAKIAGPRSGLTAPEPETVDTQLRAAFGGESAEGDVLAVVETLDGAERRALAARFQRYRPGAGDDIAARFVRLDSAAQTRITTALNSENHSHAQSSAKPSVGNDSPRAEEVGHTHNRPQIDPRRVPASAGRTESAAFSAGRHLARSVSTSKDPSAVLAAARACQAHLEEAKRELSGALHRHPEVKSQVIDRVLDLGEELAVLEAAAYRLGVGEDAAINALRTAETALRDEVGLPGLRPFWDSAVPTLQAIHDILHESTVVDKGYAYPKSHPAQHPEVPHRYRSLLNEWFLITHRSVKHTGGITVKLRGSLLATHIDQALAETMPLIVLVQNQADPNTLESVDALFIKVAEFRKRATTEIVDDAIDAKAEPAIQKGQLPIDHLSMENQLRLASMRLITATRALTSSANRLAGSNKAQAELARALFLKKYRENANIPEDLKKTLASSTSVADVAGHIDALANGIQAVMNVVDPELRQKVFHTEFDKYGYGGGTTEVLKTLGGLVQGGVAVYGVASYALLRARGFHVEASEAFAARGATLSGLSAAVNVLGAIHGGFVVYMGETTMEKATGAVEAVSGTLGVVGKYARTVPWVAKHAGPLSATLALSWTTLTWLGEKTTGALYGMIRLGLNQAYQDLRTHALEVHREATRLAVMLEMKLTDPDQSHELHKQITTFVGMLASTIRTYVNRTQAPGRDRDPGTWDAFRIRFSPLVGVKLETQFDVLAAAEQFLEIATSCFQNADAVLEESVQQSVREHGEANQHRF